MAKTLLLLLVGLVFEAGPNRTPWGPSFLYIGKYTRSFIYKFLESKGGHSNLFFVLLLKTFLSPVEKDLLLLKE